MMITVTFVGNANDERMVALKENAIGIFDFAGNAADHSTKRTFYISTTSIKEIDQVASAHGWQSFPALSHFKRFTTEATKAELIEKILNTFPDVLFTRTI